MQSYMYRQNWHNVLEVLRLRTGAEFSSSDALASREYRSPNLTYLHREITSDILQFHLSSRRSVPHEKGNEKQFLPTRPSCKMLSCKSRSGMRTDDIFLKRPINFYLGYTRNATSRCVFLWCKPRGSADVGVSERWAKPWILRGISTTIWGSVVHVGQGLRHCWAFAERDTYVIHMWARSMCILHAFNVTTDFSRQTTRDSCIWNIFGYKFAFS